MTTPSTTTEAATASDARQWQELVTWARARGIVLHELQVGSVRAAGLFGATSAARTEAPATGMSDEQARNSLYARIGGVALQQAIAESEPEGDDEDNEPEGEDEDE